MSKSTYYSSVREKPLVWKHGEIKTPPFSRIARIEAGFLLRLLQRGGMLALPVSRPMPTVGSTCHELRINDGDGSWRIVYAIEKDAIVILEVFKKTTRKTPKGILDVCKRRLTEYRLAGQVI